MCRFGNYISIWSSCRGGMKLWFIVVVEGILLLYTRLVFVQIAKEISTSSKSKD